MNRQAAVQLRDSDWEPKLYSGLDLSVLLDISLNEAQLWIKMINAGIPSLLVSHHDLRDFLKDQLGVSQVLTRPEQVSKAGHWLVEQCGWGFTQAYQRYRWIDPQDDRIRVTLRGALRIQLLRLRPDESVLDADWKAVKPLALSPPVG